MNCKPISYTFSKNCRCFSSSTTKYFIPLTGSTNENTDGSNSGVNFCPTYSGRVSSIEMTSTGKRGTTILTFEDDVAGTIGTVTFNFTGTNILQTLNFPEDFDTGNGEFNGLGRISIGIDVSSSASNLNTLVTFEVDF